MIGEIIKCGCGHNIGIAEPQGIASAGEMRKHPAGGITIACRACGGQVYISAMRALELVGMVAKRERVTAEQMTIEEMEGTR